jgi:hypothetical protein
MLVKISDVRGSMVVNIDSDDLDRRAQHVRSFFIEPTR